MRFSDVNLRLRSVVDKFWHATQFALLPPYCLLCGQRGDDSRDLCAGCASDLPRNPTCCPRCALPLQTPAPICGECLDREPPFASAWIPFVYAHPLDLLMTRFKFGRQLAAGRVLSQFWIDRFDVDRPDLPAALIPVPLHPSRLRERGYNQALELARPLSRAFGVPSLCNLLKRDRATAAQSNLDASQRRKNLRKAFVVLDDTSLPAHVALIDDVMTTGATARECARVLRRAGVERVDVWALARAPKPRSR